MKKLLLIIMIVSFAVLNAWQLSDFTEEEQNKIKLNLIEEIELGTGETIESVEGIKYNITDVTDNYWIIIKTNGDVIIVPKN